MPQVGRLTHQTREDVDLPIHFNPKTGLFSCTYLDNTYEDTGFASLKTTVLQAIAASYTLDWIAVIALKIGIGDYSLAKRREDRQSFSFYFSRERKYFAYHPDLGHKQVEWHVPPNERLQTCGKLYWEETAFALPVQTSPNSMGEVLVYLPYSDELWDQISQIERYLPIATDKLRGGFGSVAKVAATLATCRMLFDCFATRDDGEGK